MTTREKLLGRLSKLGSDAFISVQSMRQELENLGTERLSKLAKRLDLVRREEFEAVQAMVKAARLSQEALSARLAAVEKKLGVKKVITKKTKSLKRR